MSSNEKLKEYGAVTLLQRTLEKYADQNHMTIEDALKIFVRTPLYEGLFDYDGTELWKEGPDYLISLWRDLQGIENRDSTKRIIESVDDDLPLSAETQPEI